MEGGLDNKRVGGGGMVVEIKGAVVERFEEVVV